MAFWLVVRRSLIAIGSAFFDFQMVNVQNWFDNPMGYLQYQ
ncbi:hypothetical protein [Vibrio natriegens]|nr:hypothetical protein [Vibrio natriegens]